MTNIPEPDEAFAVEVRSMSKWYGDFRVLHDINLTVKDGERSRGNEDRGPVLSVRGPGSILSVII